VFTLIVPELGSKYKGSCSPYISDGIDIAVRRQPYIDVCHEIAALSLQYQPLDGPVATRPALFFHPDVAATNHLIAFDTTLLHDFASVYGPDPRKLQSLALYFRPESQQLGGRNGDGSVRVLPRLLGGAVYYPILELGHNPDIIRFDLYNNRLLQSLYMLDHEAAMSVPRSRLGRTARALGWQGLKAYRSQGDIEEMRQKAARFAAHYAPETRIICPPECLGTRRPRE
jgi:hypothetical protein